MTLTKTEQAIIRLASIYGDLAGLVQSDHIEPEHFNTQIESRKRH